MEGFDYFRTKGILKHIHCCHLSLKGGVLRASGGRPQEALVIHLCVCVCVCVCVCANVLNVYTCPLLPNRTAGQPLTSSVTGSTTSPVEDKVPST